MLHQLQKVISTPNSWSQLTPSQVLMEASSKQISIFYKMFESAGKVTNKDIYKYRQKYVKGLRQSILLGIVQIIKLELLIFIWLFKCNVFIALTTEPKTNKINNNWEKIIYYVGVILGVFCIFIYLFFYTLSVGIMISVRSLLRSEDVSDHIKYIYSWSASLDQSN